MEDIMASETPPLPSDEVDVTQFGSTSDPKTLPDPRPSGVTHLRVESEEDYYMANQRRGVALILNHVKFTNLPRREGSDKDCDDISRVFKMLGFEVRVEKDLTRRQVLQTLEALAAEDHSSSDCLVVLLMTHGKLDRFYAADSDYSSDLIWRQFTGDASPTLAGKPKLFFIQACRGEQFDSGVKVMKVCSDDVDASSKPDAPEYYVIPQMADMLIMYSTYDGHYSWRNPNQGSWFVQSLCKEFQNEAYSKDLLAMLTAVSRNVALSYQSNTPEYEYRNAKKQMPCYMSTLIKAVRFSPK